MSSRLVSLYLLFAIRLAAASQPFCAFEVGVKDPGGKPSAGVPVILVLHEATIYETITDQRGVARLCDSPAEPVDIVTGFDLCGAILIRKVSFRWPDTQHFALTYEKSFCDHTSVWPRQVLIRVHDEIGHPIEGARLLGTSSAGEGTPASDSLGRIFRVVPRLDALQGQVVKAGRVPVRISISRFDPNEVTVVLRRQ